MQGDYASAWVLLEESLSILRQFGDQSGIASTLGNLGLVAYDQGDYAGARALFEESLSIARRLGLQEKIAGGLEDMVGVALGQSQPERAARLGAASAALRESLGSPLVSLEKEEFDNIMASAAEALGKAIFAAAWNAGRAMIVDEAVDYALEEKTE